MNTNELEQRLHDYIDDELDVSQREAFEKALAQDPALREEVEAMRTLLAEAASLPREIEPPQDFWPALSQQMEHGEKSASRFTRRGRPWWAQPIVYAAAALLLIAGGMLGTMFRADFAPVLSPREVVAVLFGHTPDTVVSQEFRSAETQFIQARSQLRMAVEEQKSKLSPETLAVIEQNLDIIDNAIQDMQVALAKNPRDTRLSEQLLAMYQKQVDLLQQATQLPDES